MWWGKTDLISHMTSEPTFKFGQWKSKTNKKKNRKKTKPHKIISPFVSSRSMCQFSFLKSFAWPGYFFLYKFHLKALSHNLILWGTCKLYNVFAKRKKKVFGSLLQGKVSEKLMQMKNSWTAPWRLLNAF